ncbi:MAG: hypothetical protein ABJB11_07675 [Ferruginibacter sp.]
MKDFRSSLLVLVSLLLVISLALLITVCYHFFYRTPDYKPIVELSGKDKIVITSFTRDSLQQIYDATVQKLDNRMDAAWGNADSLNTDIDIKISEFYKLRKEITSILKDKSSNKDLESASSKISELQRKVSKLSFVSKDVEKENQRLNEIIERLSNTPEREQQPATSTTIFTESPKTTTVKPLKFAVIEIHISAYKTENEKDVETFNAKDAEKFAGSFIVKNGSAINNAEVMIVIIQPDGKVMQNSAWDAGTFQTPSGKKIYSRKLTFDYKRDESKKVQFSILGDFFPKGNYTMQLYSNGILIGKIIKALL